MTMIIRRQDVADKLADYLHHRLSLADLVDWAESVMLDGDLDERDLPVVRQVVARIGLADVRAFGLTWEDCEEILHQLGYAARVEVVTA